MPMRVRCGGHMERLLMRTTVRGAFLLVLLFLVARRADASSLLLNGGFETGTFANWTVTPGTISSLTVSTAAPESGLYAANFGGADLGGGNRDTISQTFATIAGGVYAVDFWLRNDLLSCTLTCAANDFFVSWNGTTILSRASAPSFPYTEFSFLELATGPTSTLTFSGANEPGFYRLDDVSVSAVPEPASLMLVGGGLGLLLARRRRRGRTRKNTVA
jgi:hypothetical protein